MKRNILIIFLLLFSLIFSQDKRVYIDIDNTKPAIGETFRLTLIAENIKNAKTELEGINNFRVLNSSKSVETRMVNFKTTYVEKTNYVLMPKSEGSFKLVATAQKNKYRSNPVTIVVSKASQSNQSKTEDVYVKGTLTKDEIFFGEKVILYYDLFTRYSIESYDFLEKPEFEDFIVLEQDKKNLSSSYVRIDGKKYLKHELKKYILTPTKTKNYEIPGYNFQANISVNDFWNSSKPAYMMTNPVEVNVIPLPEEGKPADFTGIVGTMNIESSYSGKVIEYGDAITLKVKVYGETNLDSLDKVVKNDIKGFKIYENEKSNIQELRDNKYYTEREIDIIIIPEKTGKISFPEIKIPYFNTKTKKYEYSKIRGLDINVTGVDQNASVVNEGNEIIEISTINYDKQEQNNNEYLEIKIRKKHFYIFAIAILVVMIILIFVHYFFSRKSSDSLKVLIKEIKKSNSVDNIFDLVNSEMKNKYGFSLKSADIRSFESIVRSTNSYDKLYEFYSQYEMAKYGNQEGGDKLKEAALEYIKTL